MENRIRILGVPVDDVDMDEAVEKIEGLVRAGRPSYVVTPKLGLLAGRRHADPVGRQDAGDAA